MVRFQIVSDIHIEVRDGKCNFLDFVKPEADVLILAGDIGSVYKYDELKQFLTEACQCFQHVLYVLGNHEYYSVRNIPVKTMLELHKDIMRMKDEINSKMNKAIMKILTTNDGGVLIGNVCVIGCTLWSQVYTEYIPRHIVRIEELNSSKSAYNSLHTRDVKYIENMVRYCQRPENNYRLMVITHHAPSYRLIADRKKGDKYCSLYATNLEHILTPNSVHTWICGHLHTNFDIRINGTRVVSNQKGKDRDRVKGFSMAKIIEI